MSALEILFWILFAWLMGEMLITAVAFIWMIFNPDARYRR